MLPLRYIRQQNYKSKLAWKVTVTSDIVFNALEAPNTAWSQILGRWEETKWKPTKKHI